MVTLYHYTSKENVQQILDKGLIPLSNYESFTELRKEVIFCWLSPKDQKIFADDAVCLEITVEEDRCMVAEMDYISLSMMYKYGGVKFGGKNLPINPEASTLFARLYEITAVPLSTYDDNFFTPEVLVKGAIRAESIKLLNVSDHQH